MLDRLRTETLRPWLVAVTLAAFVGCATSDDKNEDDEDAGTSAVRDTGGLDATFVDALRLDTTGAADTTAPDASVDANTPDVDGPDAGEDVTPPIDATVPDATVPDATAPDATVDTTPPVDATPDVTPDTGAPDIEADTPPPVEVCDNSIDDDGDARVDCDDTDCAEAPNCAPVGGGGTCEDPTPARLGENTSVPTENLESPGCLSIDEVETVFVFTPGSSGTFCADSRGSEASDTIVSLRTTCADVETELECYDDIRIDGIEFQGYGTWTASAGTPVFILVDTYNHEPGASVTLTITEGPCGGGGGDPTDVTDVACSVDAGVAFPAATPGTRALFRCPADCRDTFAVVYGTDVYSDDSDLCRAAIHAGVVTDAGGTGEVTFLVGQEEYVGSERNGVTSLDWLFGWDQSFEVRAAP